MKQFVVENVSTQVKDQKLIRHISFSIDKGSILALVGHNGAGKSTLMKTIVGIMEKTEGRMTIMGEHDHDESFLSFKQMFAYIPEEPLLLSELTVMQHFQMYGLSYQIPEEELQENVDRLVTGFELTDKLNEYPESLSKGMRQKVQTICALLPDVPLLLIDEPFMGLDIYAMEFLEKLIAEKVEQGTSILLTSHQLDRIKNLADDFIMLQHGEIVRTGAIADFETITRGVEQ